MSALDCRDDSLCSGKVLKCFYCFFVCNRYIFCTSCIIEMCMFRSDSRIVQTCGNGIYRCDLAVFVLTEIGFHSVEDSKFSGCDSCCCLCCVYTTTCCLTSDQTNVFVIDEIVECSNRIGTATYTCKYCIWKSALFLKDLLFDFFGNNCLEITDDCREWMRAHYRAKYIVSVGNTVCPLSHCLGNCIFQCCCT